MSPYNMVGYNTNRTHAGGISLRAGQFRGYGHVKIGNTTQVNETIIFNQNTSGYCNMNYGMNYGTYSSCCNNSGGGFMAFLMNCMQLIPFIGGLFGSKQTAPPEGRGDPEGKGGPPDNTEPETKVKPRDTVPKDDKKVGDDPPPVDVYAAKITPQTVVEPDITYTVKRGECWYDVLDAKYPGIPSSDRQAAMRALKLANGMTDPKSADMPRQMILPKELTVGENTYKLDNSGEVHGSVVEFTQGGMYDANIGQTETTTYTLTGTKNGESKFSKTYSDKAEAEAAKAEWLAQNKEKT